MKYLIPESIETPRLLLRQFKESDNEVYSRLMQNTEIVRYLDNGNKLNPFECWHHLSMLLGHWNLKGYGCYAVEEKSNKQLIGKIGLYSPHQWPGIELTWLLDPNFHNKGFASEAANAILKCCFENNVCTELISIIHPNNANSIKLAQNLKMNLLDSKKVTSNASLFYHINKTDWENNV